MKDLNSLKITPMKKYMSHLAMSYVPKNKAEKQAQEVAEEMNHRVMNADQVSSFKKLFLARIKKVNRDNPRCKDLELDIFGDDGTIVINLPGVFHLCLYWGFEK